MQDVSNEDTMTEARPAGPRESPDATPSGGATPPRPQSKEPEMLLTFRLQGERFAVRVAHVNEVLDPIERTRVPKAPVFAPALINVRGTVVPLFDIRRRLGLEAEAQPQDARIVVLDLDMNGETTRLALPVDSVENVIETATDSVEKLPDLGARWPRAFIEGIAFHNDMIVIILDADALFDISRGDAAHAA